MSEILAMLSLGIGLVVLLAGTAVFIEVMTVRSRLLRLEARLAALEAGAPAPASRAPAKAPVLTPVVLPVAEVAPAAKVAPNVSPTGDPVPAPPPVAPRKPAVPPGAARADSPVAPAPQRWEPERVVVWFGAGVGGIALVIGLLLALAVAVEAGLVPPTLRVLTALVAGMGLWAGGSTLRARAPVAGASLVGVGVAVLYGGVFAASELYGLWSPGLAFFVSAVVTLAAVVYGLATQARLAANLGLLGGLLAPAILEHGTGSISLRAAWMIMLMVGAQAAVVRWAWVEALLLTAGVTGLVVLGWQVDSGAVTATWALALPILLALPPAVGGLIIATRSAPARVVSILVALALPTLVGSWCVFASAPGLAAVTAALTATVLTWSLARAQDDPGVAVLAGGAQGAMWLAVVAGAHSVMPPMLPEAVVLSLLIATVLAGTGKPLRATVDLQMVTVAVALGIFGAYDVAAARLVTLACAGLVLAAAGRWSDRGERFVLGAAMFPMVLAAVYVSAPVTALTGAVALAVLASWTPVVLTGGEGWRGSRWAVAVAPAFLVVPAAAAWLELYDDGEGLVTLALGAHALTVAVVLLVWRDEPEPGARLGGMLLVGIGLVTAALPLQLETAWLTVALAVEAAVLAAVTWRLGNPVVAGGAVAIGVAVGARLLLNPFTLRYGDASGWPLLNWTLYTWGVPAVALLAASWLLRRGRVTEAWVGHGSTLLGALGIWLGFALVNVEISHAFQHDGPLELLSDDLVPGMVRSLAWVLYGTAWLVAGVWSRRRGLRFMGFGFLLLGTVKVFAVDLFSLSGIARVGSLIGLGISLVLAAWLFEKLVRGGGPDEPTREA